MKKTKGAHALRIELMNVNYHLEAAAESLSKAEKRAREVGATDQLAIAVKALRAIVNTKDSDARSRGMAKAALAKMQVTE